jgi:hypothetical protein
MEETVVISKARLDRLKGYVEALVAVAEYEDAKSYEVAIGLRRMIAELETTTQ